MKFYLLILVTISALLPTTSIFAQNNASTLEAEAAVKPIWIDMMDDTLANFFVVENAFNIYFKHHELPEGEHEEIGERRERLKKASPKKQKRIDGENNLRMQVKRYDFWYRKTLPYVQPDGRILTPTERLAIWRAQQQSR